MYLPQMENVFVCGATVMEFHWKGQQSKDLPGDHPIYHFLDTCLPSWNNNSQKTHINLTPCAAKTLLNFGVGKNTASWSYSFYSIHPLFDDWRAELCIFYFLCEFMHWHCQPTTMTLPRKWPNSLGGFPQNSLGGFPQLSRRLGFYFPVYERLGGFATAFWTFYGPF